MISAIAINRLKMATGGEINLAKRIRMQIVDKKKVADLGRVS